MPWNELPERPRKIRDPLNITGGHSDSKAEGLEILGWLNPVTLIAVLATGVNELFGKIFGRSSR